MAFLLRYGPTILVLVLVVGVTAWGMNALSTLKALKVEKAAWIQREADLSAQMAGLQERARFTDKAHTIAREASIRHEENAAELRQKLATFKKDKCDATDTDCLADFINDLLR